MWLTWQHPGKPVLKGRLFHAFVEVGMGGGFDSTNVVRPRNSVITNVNLDHMDRGLGDRLRRALGTRCG